MRSNFVGLDYVTSPTYLLFVSVISGVTWIPFSILGKDGGRMIDAGISSRGVGPMLVICFLAFLLFSPA